MSSDLDGTGPDDLLAEAGAAVESVIAPADAIDNEVLVDPSRYTPAVGLLFTVCAVVLVPWIVYIGLTLPARELSPNYDLAWAGFDMMLFGALATTAGCAVRRSPRVGIAAAWSAALLVTDAWFDTVTSPVGWPLVQSVAMTLLVELPLAAVCVWTIRHARDIAEQRIRLLMHR